MKKTTIFRIVSLVLGIIIAITAIVLFEVRLRFKYRMTENFFCSFDPKLLSHITIFNRSWIPHVDDNPPRIFCVGGSTTNGCSMPMEYSYPNILQSLFTKNHKKGTVYNFGVSGVASVTTNFFVKNIISKYQPQGIIIHDGYNDLPIVINKLAEDKYSYITPDYYHTFNPYIRNPVARFIYTFLRWNLRATRRLVLTRYYVNKNDLFLGFDYKKYKLKEGTSAQIWNENGKRLRIMISNEIDTIDYCLVHGIKVIIILEPFIKPLYFVPEFGSSFRDPNVGAILSECHKNQQAVYAAVMQQKYGQNPNVVIVDMRELFKDKYEELFYDECHLNGTGNLVKAQVIYNNLEKLLP